MIDYSIEIFKIVFYSLVLYFIMLWGIEFLSGLDFTKQDEYLLLTLTTTYVLLERRKLEKA